MVDAWRDSDLEGEKTVFLATATDSGFSNIEQGYRYDNFDIVDRLIEKVKEMKEDKADPLNVKPVHLLVVIDDMGDILKTPPVQRTLTEIAIKGRHLTGGTKSTISFIIISQRYKLLPPVVRSNSDLVFTNKISSAMERVALFDESLYLLSTSRQQKAEVHELYQRITNVPFGFCVAELYKNEGVTTNTDFICGYHVDLK
jgi:hypothetical protein